MKLINHIQQNYGGKWPNNPFRGAVAEFSRDISKSTGRNIRRQTVEYWIREDYDWLDGSVCKRLTEPKS